MPFNLTLLSLKQDQIRNLSKVPQKNETIVHRTDCTRVLLNNYTSQQVLSRGKLSNHQPIRIQRRNLINLLQIKECLTFLWDQEDRVKTITLISSI